MSSEKDSEGIGPWERAEASTKVARPKTELEAKIGPVFDYFGDEVNPMQKATILAICGRIKRERTDTSLDDLAKALRFLRPAAFIAEYSDEDPKTDQSENTKVVDEVAETFRNITEGLRRTGTTSKRTTGSQTVPASLRTPAEPDNRTVVERMEDERVRMHGVLAARNAGGRRASQTFRAPTAAELAEARRAQEREKAEKRATEETPPKTEAKPGDLLDSVRETHCNIQNALDVNRNK